MPYVRTYLNQNARTLKIYCVTCVACWRKLRCLQTDLLPTYRYRQGTYLDVRYGTVGTWYNNNSPLTSGWCRSLIRMVQTHFERPNEPRQYLVLVHTVLVGYLLVNIQTWSHKASRSSGHPICCYPRTCRRVAKVIKEFRSTILPTLNFQNLRCSTTSTGNVVKNKIRVRT
jgi:hypothetical protein